MGDEFENLKAEHLKLLGELMQINVELMEKKPEYDRLISELEQTAEKGERELASGQKITLEMVEYSMRQGNRINRLIGELHGALKVLKQKSDEKIDEIRRWEAAHPEMVVYAIDDAIRVANTDAEA